MAGYSPEVIRARDVLTQQMRDLANQTQQEFNDSDRVRVSRDGTFTTVELGCYSDDFSKTFSRHLLDQDFAALTGLTSNEPHQVWATVRNPDTPDFDLLGLEQPEALLEWSETLDRGYHRTSRLSIYSDGYVESSSEEIRRTLGHPDNADPLIVAFAQPTVRAETMHTEARPAELPDIQQATDVLNAAANKYGLIVR